MELRKHRKAPQRYDDVEYEDEAQQELSSKVKIIPPAFQEKFVQFNPHLPPAAFPTHDNWLPSNNTNVAAEDRFTCQDQISQSQQITCDLYLEDRPQVTSHLFLPTPTDCHEEHYLPHEEHYLLPENYFLDGENLSNMPLRRPYIPYAPEPSFQMATSMEEEAGQNYGPEFSMYERNMKIMDKLSARTDEDWNIAEMETSDEEEAVLNRPQESAKQTSGPRWEDLSVAHQVDLVNTMAQTYDSIEDAMHRLHLNPTQAQAITKLVIQREKFDEMEDANMAKLQNRVHQILLAGHSNGVRHMSQARYQELWEEHLGNCHLGEVFYITTRESLAKAQVYLENCGYDKKLLNHWEVPFHLGEDSEEDIQLERSESGVGQKLSNRQDLDVPRSKPLETAKFQTDRSSAMTKQTQHGKSRSLSSVTSLQDSNGNNEPIKELRAFKMLSGITEAARSHGHQDSATLPTPPLTAIPDNHAATTCMQTHRVASQFPDLETPIDSSLAARHVIKDPLVPNSNHGIRPPANNPPSAISPNRITRRSRRSTPLAINTNRDTLAPTTTTPKPKNKRKSAGAGAAGHVVMTPRDGVLPMIIKFPHRSRARRGATADKSSTSGNGEKGGNEGDGV